MQLVQKLSQARDSFKNRVSTKNRLPSLSKRLRHSRNFQEIPMCRTSWLIPWLLLSGSVVTWKKVSCASYSVAFPKNSLKVDVVDSEVKLTSCFAVILQPLNRNCCNMFTKLRQEASIPLVRVVRPLVSLFTSPRTRKLANWFSKVVLWSFLIEVFAALTSLTRWTTTRESSFMKPWSNRLFQWLRPA